MSVPGVPSSVIRALQTVRLDFGVQPDAGVIDSRAANTQKPQQELVILERAYAILDALHTRRKDADDVEHRPAER